MTTGETLALHHRREGPEEAPVLVLSNSPGTTREMIPDAANLATIERFEAITRAILDRLGPVVGEGR